MIPVTAQCIDFTVMCYQPERLGQVPGGKRVCTVSLVNNRKHTHKIFITKVAIKMMKILSVHKAFVVKRAAGHARYIKLAEFVSGKSVYFIFYYLSDNIQFPLEISLITGTPGKKELAHLRL